MCKYNPRIDLWAFIYLKDDAEKVDDKITKFVERFAASNEKKINMRGYMCKPTGAIHGHEKFDDGKIIITPLVEEIERVDKNYLLVKTQYGSYYIDGNERIDP